MVDPEQLNEITSNDYEKNVSRDQHDTKIDSNGPEEIIVDDRPIEPRSSSSESASTMKLETQDLTSSAKHSYSFESRDPCHILDEEYVCIIILPIFKRTKEHQRRPSGSRLDYRHARRPKSV